MKLIGNVGKDDRIIRAIIGIAFISMVFVGPETMWGWFGLVPLLTAGIGFCPLYTKLGFNTSGKTEEDAAAQDTTQDAIQESTVAEQETVQKQETVQESVAEEVKVEDAIQKSGGEIAAEEPDLPNRTVGTV